MTFATVQTDCDRLHLYCQKHKGTALSLDLSKVEHCDSAGLALLIEAKRLGAEQKKDCIIEGVPKSVKALAEFCGVDTLLGLC